MEELTPPGAPRYEQLADKLRRRIFDGEWPHDASGPSLGKLYGVSQTAVQKAFEILGREGLVTLEAGRRTTLTERHSWLVEIVLPDGDDGTVLAAAAVEHAAVQRISTAPGIVTLTVASASWGGAASVVASVAGELPVRVVTIRKARE